MSRRVAIPDFVDGDVRSLAATLRAIKQEIETISGIRQGQSRGAPAVFVEEREPSTNQNIVFKTGDLWIKPSLKELWYYNGQFWAKLV